MIYVSYPHCGNWNLVYPCPPAKPALCILPALRELKPIYRGCPLWVIGPICILPALRELKLIAWPARIIASRYVSYPHCGNWNNNRAIRVWTHEFYVSYPHCGNWNQSANGGKGVEDICILPALRELKPGRGGSDIRFIGMYLTRTAGIETIVVLWGSPQTSLAMYLTRTAGIETAGFSTDKRAGNMYLTRTAGIETPCGRFRRGRQGMYLTRTAGIET